MIAAAAAGQLDGLNVHQSGLARSYYIARNHCAKQIGFLFTDSLTLEFDITKEQLHTIKSFTLQHFIAFRVLGI